MEIEAPLPAESRKPDSSDAVNSILGNVSRQGSVVLLTRGAAIILGLASSVLLSRILGPTGLGEFRLGSVVVQLTTAFCILGMDKALSRHLPMLEARGVGGSRNLLLRGSGLVLTIALGLSAILLLGAPWLATHYFRSAEMTAVIRAFCIQIPIFSLFRFLSGAVTAAKRVDFSSKISNILSPAIFLSLLGLFYFTYPGIFGTITARIVAQAAAVACLALFLFRRYPSMVEERAASNRAFRTYFGLALPLFLIGFSYQLLNQMDTIMLGHFVSPRDVGVYSVAFKLSAFILMPIEILLPIVAPLFSQLSETRDRHATEVLFQTVTKWLCYSALAIFTFIAMFRTELLTIFGDGFAAGASLIPILGVGQLANAMTGPTGVLLTMTGKQRWEMGNTIVMIAVNFLLNLILIPKLGRTGAAISTASSIALVNLAKLVQVYWIYGYQAYNRNYLKGIGAIAAAALGGFFFRNALTHIGVQHYVVIALVGLAFVLIAGAGLLLMGLDGEDKIALAALRRGGSKRGRLKVDAPFPQ